MKKRKQILALALAAVLMGALLTGCKAQLTSVARKVLGTSETVQEEDTTRWAELTSDPLMLEGITDATVKYAEAFVSTRLNVVFNGIYMSRRTQYFTAPNGSITITACGTAEGSVQRFKVAVWQKVDGGAQYVNGSTGYIHTDGQNYRYVVTGLDPAASYRLTISYDSSRYYLYGMVQVEGVSG